MNSQQANPNIVAVIQLLTFVVAFTGVVIIVAQHALPPAASVALVAAGLTHAGYIGYNGATKANGVPTKPGL